MSSGNDHPGGNVIFTHAGDDATDIMMAFHSPAATNALDRFYIGDLDETVYPEGFYANKKDPAEQRRFEAGYRALRSKLIAGGFFESSKLYYVYKVLTRTLTLTLFRTLTLTLTLT